MEEQKSTDFAITVAHHDCVSGTLCIFVRVGNTNSTESTRLRASNDCTLLRSGSLIGFFPCSQIQFAIQTVGVTFVGVNQAILFGTVQF